MGNSSNEPEIRGELAKKILAEKVRICTECETEYSGLAKFCTDCGSPLARAEPKKKSNKDLNSALIVFGLMTIGVVTWIWYIIDSVGDEYVSPFALMFPALLLWILLTTTCVLGCVRLSRTGLPQPLKWFLIILSSSPAWIWIPAIFISASLYEG